MINYDMVCARCRYALNAIDNATDSADADPASPHLRYEHPVSPHSNHHPLPVPAHTVEHVYRRCHFCSDAEPIWQYRSAAIEAMSIGGSSTIVQEYSTQWHACWDCSDAIEHDDTNSLTHRSIAVMGWQPDDFRAQILAGIHRAVIIGREPDRTLVTTSRWTPAQLRAATLPKIRDRLAALYRGPISLPRPLHDPALRHALAGGLDQGHLYWIDPEFTNLVTDVYADLPDTTITERIVPSTSGLLVWSTPTDPRHDIAATSWATHASGWTIVCYRSIGADLPATTMQTVRHDIGWLIPIHTVHIAPGTVINGDDPLATVVSTWLLVAQELTEIAPAPVEPGIRKAYARTRRPAPEVRLIRIKAKRTAETSPLETTTRGASGRATPDHRYWVSGHQRNQAYGPNRSLRKTIDIDPFLKGPDDKPIRASTTVRILGTNRTDEPNRAAEPNTD